MYIYVVITITSASLRCNVVRPQPGTVNLTACTAISGGSLNQTVIDNCTVVHEVKPGDTCAQIALVFYDISIARLLQLNPSEYR